MVKAWRGYDLDRLITITVQYFKQQFALPTGFGNPSSRGRRGNMSPPPPERGGAGRGAGRGGFGLGRGGRGGDSAGPSLLGRALGDAAKSAAAAKKPGGGSREQDDLGFNSVRRTIPQRDLQLYKETQKNFTFVVDNIEKVT